jgi:coenzyme F420-reducing hydrogenase alpha subunit
MKTPRKNPGKQGTTNTKKRRNIAVDYLARVEGEGSLYVKIAGKTIEDIKLKIFEPPRFFEAFLRGRRFTEAPDITARICGICPVAYQMSACHAMEQACGVTVGGPLRELRRLLYCGEWIESHVLHVYMLHAPDFLGYPSSIELAQDHPEAVKKALELKKIGNDLMGLIGGREIHPINVRVGGFYRVPTRKELGAFRGKLERAADLSREMIAFSAGLEFPDFDQDYEMVALRHPDEYPFNEGRLVSNKGLDIEIGKFYDHFAESHVAHSNALHCQVKARGSYLVGPMARYSLNFDRFPEEVQRAAREAGLGKVVTNPFKSIIVRSIETLYACLEGLRIVDAYEMPDQPAVKVKARAGTGHGCTEAPRGILYHRYTIGADGLIQDSKIVPPTSQNQKRIEDDLYHYVEGNLDLVDAELQLRCEQAIRNYDPCISCATHFLNLRVERR